MDRVPLSALRKRRKSLDNRRKIAIMNTYICKRLDEVSFPKPDLRERGIWCEPLAYAGKQPLRSGPRGAGRVTPLSVAKTPLQEGDN